jgi:hypothetical protein
LSRIIESETPMADWIESHITEAAQKLDDVYRHVAYGGDESSGHDHKVKNQLIHLGSNHPDLRDHIRPVLDKMASSEDELKEELTSMDQREFEQLIREGVRKSDADFDIHDDGRKSRDSFTISLGGIGRSHKGSIAIGWAGRPHISILNREHVEVEERLLQKIDDIPSLVEELIDGNNLSKPSFL